LEVRDLEALHLQKKKTGECEKERSVGTRVKPEGRFEEKIAQGQYEKREDVKKRGPFEKGGKSPFSLIPTNCG